MSIADYVSESLCIDKDHLMRFCASAPYRYKIYNIPKRSGNGFRTIAHPAKQLKFIQRLIVTQLDNLTENHHRNAFAYKTGVSIRDNAKAHLKNQFLLKMDFKDFFPSITPELMFQEYRRLGVKFTEEDRVLLSNFLFFKLRKNSSLKLSIGAPSSPFISNLVMYHFDEVISNFCERYELTYTRYADDLTFSTNTKDLLFTVPKIVKSFLKNEGYDLLRINSEKTVFTSKGHNRHVTGVTLANSGNLSIGRDRKRTLSASVHRHLLGKLSLNETEILKGHLSFAFYIEPEFKIRLKKKYGENALSSLFSG